MGFAHFRPVLALVFVLGAGLAHAQGEAPPAATFIDPADGAVVDPSQPIRWTSQPEALAYYLYVGTAPGTRDLIDSRETQATQWSARSLPVGRTLYARIHTKYASKWVSSSITFSVKPVAVFTNPAASGTTVAPNFRFEWTPLADAQAYFLYVGSAPGLHDYVSTGEIQTTYYNANLPAGHTVYAQLHTLYGGVWRSVSLTLNVSPVATFITPQDNDQNFDPRLSLRWRAVDGAEAYYLYVGTARGRKDLVDSRETQATSWPAMFIPAGETVYARLHTKHGGTWRYVDIAFRLAPTAIFIEPNADDAEVDPRAPLMWTDVPSAQAYYLYVGSTPGASDLLGSGEIMALSRDISTLPRGRTLYATLHTKSGGVWRSVRRPFRIKPVATLLDRADAPSQIDTRLPLKWFGVDAAQAYYLYVGTTPGAKDLLDSRETQATQFSIQSLPAGKTVYVRLFTKHGGVWRYVDSTIKTRSVAYLTGAVAGAGSWSAGTGLTWSAFAGASKYYVYVGTAPGRMDISSSGEVTGTAFTMPLYHATTLTDDQQIYVRLYSLVDGKWNFVDYTVQYQAAAQLEFPRAGDLNVDVIALPMQWSKVTSAEHYRVQIGTSPGDGSVLDTGEVNGHGIRTGVLPGGVTLFARIWTQVAGSWRYTDSSFVTRPAAAFTNPTRGQLNVDLSQPLEWTSVPGADMYRVELGSTPGAHDLLDTGQIAANSADASAVLAAMPDVIYGRVWTRHGGKWRFSWTTFAISATPAAASMTWQTTADTFDAGDAFRWTPAPMAASYRLRIGMSPGTDDVYDSGSIRTVRHMVDGLPTGVKLYGMLDTEYLDGTVATESFEFTVVQADIDFEDRWSQVLWATAEVRGMAGMDNVPMPNSFLIDAARFYNRESAATCTDYATALLNFLVDLNPGIDARPLGVCLNELECHKLVEVYVPDLDRWVIVDPTFGLVARRVSDGSWASALDIHAATHAGTFSDIEYVMLTASGTAFADNYYLDYPLLYGRVYQTNTWSTMLAQLDSAEPFLELLPTSSVTQYGYYMVRCLQGQDTVTLHVTGSGLATDQDGNALLPCEVGNDGFSRVFIASGIDPVDDADAYEIARPLRFVFD